MSLRFSVATPHGKFHYGSLTSTIKRAKTKLNSGKCKIKNCKMLMKTNIFRQSSVLRRFVRTFLSESYSCTESWNSRLNAPFMQNANLDQLYYNMDQRYQQNKKISAIDVDIFVNRAEGNTHLEEVADLVHKLRQTEETSAALDSTGHAVIRNFLDADHTEELLQILNNRLGYGVFLDHYIASYGLNKLIKANDFKSAAQISSMLMLQEDFSNELSKALSLYACFKYAKNPHIKPVDKGTVEEPKDEVKVRVKFLRNPYFDDHFDLEDTNLLIGKTMDMLGDTLDDPLRTNFKLVGLTLYQKFNKAASIIDSSENFITKEFATIAQNILKKYEETIKENEEYDQLKAQIETLLSKQLKESQYEEELKTFVKNAVEKHEKTEIQLQNELYKKWCTDRESALQAELNRLQRVQRLENIEKLTKDMEEEEQKLWFFENEEKIELEIESKKVYYPKRWFGKKKKPRVVDEDYVPPEIRAQR